MNGFLLALKSELFVSLRSVSSKMVLGIPVTLVILQLVLTRVRDAGSAVTDNMLGRTDFDIAMANNAYGHLVDGLNTGLSLLGLLLVAQAATCFSGERDSGAIRHLLIRCCSRRAVVLAKLLHLHLLGLIALLLLLGSCFLVSSLLWEFGAVAEDGFELISQQEIRHEIRLGLHLALLPLPAAMAMGLLVSVVANSSTQAVVSALGLTLALDLFKSVLGDKALYLYTTYQPSLLDQSYLGEVSRLVRGYSDVLIDPHFLEMNNLVPLPSLLIMVALMLVAVERRTL
ncbi:MAG: ABC transporter permease subunit [Gammaproteobacteria bacterium]|nr:ABC transporter permease subunit [Gammaproteobacteria bacterium]MCY4357082.1 ABC transporter permease subunit [Gammaproteobacteria bacterium]